MIPARTRSGHRIAGRTTLRLCEELLCWFGAGVTVLKEADSKGDAVRAIEDVCKVELVKGFFLKGNCTPVSVARDDLRRDLVLKVAGENSGDAVTVT